MKLIVTAGGQGTKVWPLSREAKPKQFQSLVGKISSYKQAVSTLLKAYKASDIYISTKKRYASIASRQSPEIPKENYIFEPDIAKDRGPGEGIAFITLNQKHPDEPFMIIQADNLRLPEEKFLKTIEEAEKIEKRDKKFMSGGVKATYPILGIDYLRLGKRIRGNDIEIYQTDEFIPRVDDYHQTKDLINNFHVATHSNHNCWYPGLMLEAYKKHRPDWYQSLLRIGDLLNKPGSDSRIDEIYSQMEAGGTELVTSHVFKDGYTILLPFKWIDFGTWDSVYEFADPQGEVSVDGEVIAIDTKNSLIKSTNAKKIIAVCGVENLVVVDTKDALLVCRKDRSQDVKQIIALLKQKNMNKFL
ncbi:hypothetical protein A2368_04515 [Candidatus Collierbacteria bacterium RIFOXYB1_FULL_49_13]|uniref:Nucleotidyl transferase domain-containing protein n=1 Tax=Candidatus Collierbacteria bacterium RIFOXYB1_FULL_49_13 TaxID=1817728 RepID=A0A1F5FH82_9BACT|nr:MAG: hypothetical protein A2368_04515 [Candidatus Collierbacteria bacterium RIFOXYB1_FULL_49_13]